MSRVVIFANGNLPNLEKARALVEAQDFVICADGGTRHAFALGIIPRLVIGDMDSASKDEVHRLKQARVEIELYPRDKNETDLELAMNRALEQRPSSICIIGSLGGRLDQTLANISLLSDPRLSAINCRLDDGVEEVFFCRDHAQVEGRGGDIVSLIPWNGAVNGIRTNGLRWPLNDESLYPDRTRGISNEMTENIADVHIESGLLLIIHSRSWKGKS